jgi:KDO2-lipid IV(A) lauroyltransferase
MKIKRSFKNAVEYYAALALITLLRRLPRRTGIILARGLAVILYSLMGKQRNNTLSHLKLAYGNEKTDKEIRRIARSVFRHFLTAGVDAARIPIFIKEGMNRYIRADNMNYFEHAFRRGKGMILLTAHFGNWELLGAWLTWKGYPLRVVGSPIANPKLDQLVTETRNQAGYFNIARGTETREIIRSLKQGCPLGILMDQDTRVKGVFVDFFGRKANTPVGPVLLARRFDIPIIPAFMHLEPDLTYHVECLPPIPMSHTGDPERDILSDVQQCSIVYERIIRQHPEQWAWFHRRWRQQPDANRHQ